MSGLTELLRDRALSGLAPESEKTPESRLPLVRNGGKWFHLVRPDSVQESEPGIGQADERRLEIVRNSRTGFPEVRLNSVRSGPRTALYSLQRMKAGGRSHRKNMDRPHVSFRKADFLPMAQNLPKKLQMQLQHIAVSGPDPSGGRRRRQRVGSAGETHRRTGGTEVREGLHEKKSEI